MAIFVPHKVSKIVNLLSPAGFFQPQNTQKFVFGWDYDPPLDPLLGWGEGHPIDAFSISILGASLLDAFSVSIRA